jgi:hypothetical protein
VFRLAPNGSRSLLWLLVWLLSYGCRLICLGCKNPVRLPALVMFLYCCGTTVVVTTHTLHVVCVLLVCGPSPYTGYQVGFLCLMGKVRLVLMLILLDLSFYTAKCISPIGLLLYDLILLLWRYPLD